MNAADPATESPAAPPEPSPTRTARSFFQISSGFWKGRTQRRAWILTALLFTVALHAGAEAVLAAAFAFGFGALGWNAILYVSAGERAPAELAGRSFAVAATVVFVVSGLCTPPLGALAAYAGWNAFWVATAALAGAGALVAAHS